MWGGWYIIIDDDYGRQHIDLVVYISQYYINSVEKRNNITKDISAGGEQVNSL